MDQKPVYATAVKRRHGVPVPAARAAVRSRAAQALVAVAIAACSVAAVQAIGSGPASAAGGCAAGRFCAFNDNDYRGLLLSSAAARGSNAVDVGDNLTSSGSNLTSNNWVGVTKRTGLPDQTVFTFAAGTDVPWVGAGANDRIDHFNVR